MHQSPDILASFGDWETRMERALASVRAGRGVLVVDDEDRENEGDLIYPAHSLTDAQMARLIRHCSGIVCLCLTDERATRLGLPPMVAHNTNTQQTAFTISIEAAEGVTTGVSAADRVTTVKAAVADKERGMGNYNAEVDEGAYDHIARIANGDVRTALNAIELAILTTEADGNGVIHITEDIAAESIQQKLINCDDQQFYDMLSAFCKSLRGGDSDAAIAWFARLIYAGIDPRIICRRLIAHASEDVGLANPQAMVQAVAAAQALEFIGMPEAGLSITQAIIFICESPKSNSVVIAKDTAFAEAKSIPDQPVPIHLRDTSYPGASKLGHGRGYKYPHDYPGHVVAQEYMPPSVKGHKYYIPGELGSEGKIRQNHINQGRIKEK